MRACHSHLSMRWRSNSLGAAQLKARSLLVCSSCCFERGELGERRIRIRLLVAPAGAAAERLGVILLALGAIDALTAFAPAVVARRRARGPCARCVRPDAPRVAGVRAGPAALLADPGVRRDRGAGRRGRSRTAERRRSCCGAIGRLWRWRRGSFGGDAACAAVTRWRRRRRRSRSDRPAGRQTSMIAGSSAGLAGQPPAAPPPFVASPSRPQASEAGAIASDPGSRSAGAVSAAPSSSALRQQRRGDLQLGSRLERHPLRRGFATGASAVAGAAVCGGGRLRQQACRSAVSAGLGRRSMR